MKECPDCDTQVEIPQDATIGEIVSCSCCGYEFEVIKKDGKLELKTFVIIGEELKEDY